MCKYVYKVTLHSDTDLVWSKNYFWVEFFQLIFWPASNWCCSAPRDCWCSYYMFAVAIIFTLVSILNWTWRCNFSSAWVRCDRPILQFYSLFSNKKIYKFSFYVCTCQKEYIYIYYIYCDSFYPIYPAFMDLWRKFTWPFPANLSLEMAGVIKARSGPFLGALWLAVSHWLNRPGGAEPVCVCLTEALGESGMACAS